MPAVRIAWKLMCASALSGVLIGPLLPVLPARAQDASEEQMQSRPPSAQAEPGLEKFHPGATRAQWYNCGCYDAPIKHYPYSIVVFEMPAHDLIVRPERQESGFKFVPLAHRYGDRYCTLDSEQDCYGSFPHPCDFTDYRYGPSLADYFPTCKSPDEDDR